jgi:hypothetical protein
MRQAALIGALTAVLGFPAGGFGGSTPPAFDGGTPRQRAAVRQALVASTFDWGMIRNRVTVHIRDGVVTRAAPGHIWLDARLLDRGRKAWGVVQHEFAHQVDFLLLDKATRSRLRLQLGGEQWFYEGARLEHSDYGCERFASTLAWAYWPSTHNTMRPALVDGESAAMPAAEFRGMLDRLLADGAAERPSGAIAQA